ncbi:MAG TPA: endonuclease/exonuclease/phosphatase family protein [Candidatus Gastranaerophilales bacterium]|nr:endonuclease/exonuclease/phosphatase family protein [Candidatus Gastranaerophilales bacterium]
MKKILIQILIIILIFVNISVFASTKPEESLLIEKNDFKLFLTFDELIKLSKTKELDEELANKLNIILYNPVIDNTIAPKSDKLKENPVLGEFIRVASWNIARGLNLNEIEMVFNDPEQFLIKARNRKDKLDKKYIKEVQKQIEILKETDIFLLNEVDIGMPRTNYKNVAEEFAEMLGYNYAFGVEFVEVDPTHLGLEDYEWSEENILFPDKDYIVDKSKYKGLHGNAIISRYPLKNVRIVRLPDVYGWFDNEKNKIAGIEVARRKAAELIFEESVLREIRRGSRMALIADVEIPGAEKPLTVISIHLENRAIPQYRYEQMKILLEQIKTIENPIILAGDLNTTTKDGSPTTIIREVKKKIKDVDFIAKQLIYIAIPQSLVITSANLVTNVVRTHNNPTVRNIPIVSPNKERKLFNAVKDTDFSDGGKFDFSGKKYKSINDKWGMLANSNERSLKGFVPTFMFNRDLVLGQFKLDWIFVKPYEVNENNKKISRFTPFFGRTLLELNYAQGFPLSDHAPITVDLPFNSPNEHEVETIIHKLEKLEKQ